MSFRHLRFSMLFVLLVQVNSLFAQYVEEDEPEKIPARHRSLGLNITPAFPMLMGAIPFNPRLGVVYKHQTKTSRKFRIAANVQIFDPFEIDPNFRTYGYYNTSDTTQSHQYIGDDRWDVDVRFGLEWMNPDKKITPFYGFDLILGHIQKDDFYGTRNLKLDTSICETCYYFDIYNPGTSNLQTTYYLYAGFDFTVGWKILIKNNVDLYLQFAPEFRYEAYYREVLDLEDEKKFSPDSGIDFRIRALETWLCYRF